VELIDGLLWVTWGNRSAGSGDPLVLSTVALDVAGQFSEPLVREGLPGAWMDAMGYSPAGDIGFAFAHEDYGSGHVAGPEVVTTTLDTGDGVYPVTTHVAWDGEAFTIDRLDDGKLFVLRRSATGPCSRR